MSRSRTVAIAASAAIASVVAITPAMAAPVPAAAALPTIIATSVNGATLSLTGTAHLTPGRVRIVLHAKGQKDDNGAEVALLRFLPGYSFAGYLKDFKTYGANQGKNGPNKKAIAALDHFLKHTVQLGGVDVDQDKSASGTLVLTAGTYVAYNDDGAAPANPVAFHVNGAPRHGAGPRSSAIVTVTRAGNRFGGPTTLPAHGTITFTNRSKGLHAQDLDLLHVKAGTTLKQVLAYFRSGSESEPSFGRPGFIGTDLLGAGKSQTLTYSVPKGEYVEASFAPSATTGLPYVLAGMVRIVQLR